MGSYPVTNRKLLKSCEQGSEIQRGETMKFISVLQQVGLNQGRGKERKRIAYCIKQFIYLTKLSIMTAKGGDKILRKKMVKFGAFLDNIMSRDLGVSQANPDEIQTAPKISTRNIHS